jgi:hypothetical protein
MTIHSNRDSTPKNGARLAKRTTGPTRAASPTTTDAPGATTATVIEQRVVAFAEQLGRMVGTIQAKAEGWMDRDTLHQQLANVRDGAAHLLEQLAAAATTATQQQPAPPAARGRNKGRSGGVVDAPGKKHRKRAPTDPSKTVAKSQAAKMRTAMPMEKTNRRRGRG